MNLILRDGDFRYRTVRYLKSGFGSGHDDFSGRFSRLGLLHRRNRIYPGCLHQYRLFQAFRILTGAAPYKISCSLCNQSYLVTPQLLLTQHSRRFANRLVVGE